MIDSAPEKQEKVKTVVKPPSASIQWTQCLELGYEETSTDEASSDKEPVCFGCGKSQEDASNKKCAKCHVASYCSRECQIKDWKGGTGGGHKFACEAFARVGSNMKITKEEDQASARQDIFARIRFYACPYAVQKTSIVGKGFIFTQSDCTLAELSLPTPTKNSYGRPIQRSPRAVLLHFLTVGEYDSEVCKDDFELASVRTQLQTAVDEYNDKESVVLLMRFRCGHVALGVAPLTPDYGICKSLGESYYAESTAGALQLNLDDI
mmetsp:Transcript_21662/g.33390  ORF Transcript_21662/g.33390 Transcript_21662/m.33390 type:complete len:265 (-) Transcript_21662:165-959(-)|eukprot:CAMPEP_0195309078 /NCGR_PEP_ID=MMETSP0707-20130614/38557_1 /TAXON_ID=33640 /ORGANISM="Asterionellopsis glacialis, Strain CCMP134" /LENGTH=264 /DNA_ID=CAMNT_0040373373 /DNA_START=34 /DNA_END=828 /DNA_ORIENTATION=+